MHLPLAITTAIAAELATRGLAAAVHAHGSTESRATPLLAVICQNFNSPHPHFHQGQIILRYEFDADLTTTAAAALELQTAADHLATSAALAAINAALAPDSIWLRRLTPAGGTSTLSDTGERTRTMDSALIFHAQTKI
jgi:hypothetical protein